MTGVAARRSPTVLDAWAAPPLALASSSCGDDAGGQSQHDFFGDPRCASLTVRGRVEEPGGAFAVAIIILVHGAGVSQSVPNPDGSPRSMSRDFIGQGAANLASGLFQGLPVGGSCRRCPDQACSGSCRDDVGVDRFRWSPLVSTGHVSDLPRRRPRPSSGAPSRADARAARRS